MLDHVKEMHQNWNSCLTGQETSSNLVTFVDQSPINIINTASPAPEGASSSQDVNKPTSVHFNPRWAEELDENFKVLDSKFSR